MADTQFKGLTGLNRLDGWDALSEEQKKTFMNQKKDLLAKHGFDPNYTKQLYRNNQYIEKYGLDTFKALDNNTLEKMYKNDVVNEAFEERFSPFKLTPSKYTDESLTQKVFSAFRSAEKNKEIYERNKFGRDNSLGLGADYEKYLNNLSTEGKLKLLKSGFQTDQEFNKEWQDKLKHERELQDTWGAYLSGLETMGSAPMNRLDTFDETVKKANYDRNKKILERVYAEDLKERTQQEDIINAKNAFYNQLQGVSDEEIEKQFIKAYTRSGNNLGIESFAVNHNRGVYVEDEMKNFSIDDMRNVLAKKAAYEYYMSPEAAHDALENEAKKYIADNQGALTKFGLWSRDVGIATMSYTADKVNGVYNVGLRTADAMFEHPTVWVDDEGSIVDSNNPTITTDAKGHSIYTGKDGKQHFIHQEQIARTTLHNMGKSIGVLDSAGSEDKSLLNPQYWSDAEQTGTLSKALQEQYKTLGVSPYKVALEAGEETGLLYESGKMMSFGLADGVAQLIPFGIGRMGRALATIDKTGKVLNTFGRAMDFTGRMLTAESKVGQVTQGLAGAAGIAYAYQRGAFQETLQQNNEMLEDNVRVRSMNDIYSKYQEDEGYRKDVNAKIDAEASKLKKQYLAKIGRDNNRHVVDEQALDKMLRAQAQDKVVAGLVDNRIAEVKASDEYANYQQAAIKEAGDAAFNTFAPEALKYGLVNTIGWRKWLYSNPNGIRKAASSMFKGLKNVTNTAGKERLIAEPSKFLTTKAKWAQLGKTIGSQMWGGAWTNGSDDMMVDAAERINEDQFSLYSKGFLNRQAIADTYSIADGLYSYWKGLNNSLGQGTTWNAAAVGGLGSILSFTPNFVNIASLATKSGREHYKNNYLRRNLYENDANGFKQLQKDENGNPVTENISRKENWRDRMSFFINNGVLSTYYGAKQNERELQDHADFVNNLLDHYNDFEIIEDLVASDIGNENASNIGDKKTMRYIEALKAVNALDHLGNSKEDPASASAVIQKKKELIKKVSEMKFDGSEDSLTDEEVNDLLTEYYSTHEGIAKSSYNSQKALYEMQQNAQKMMEASTALDEAEKELQKAENRNHSKIEPVVREKIKLSRALDGHWRDRRKKMKDEIEDNSSDDAKDSQGNEVSIAGGIKRAEQLIKVYDQQYKELEAEKEKQSKVVADKDEARRKALIARVRVVSGDKETGLFAAPEQAALDKAEAEYKDAVEQLNYLNDLQTVTTNKKTALTKSLEQQKETGEKILSADEIFNLDAVSRAKMLKEENRGLYSKEQQKEIEKLEDRLLMKDADALQKIQDIALLTQRINTNEDAYGRMMKNPEAAAIALENQKTIEANAASHLINYKNAEILSDAVRQVSSDVVSQFNNRLTSAQEAELRSEISKLLRRYSSNVLGIINTENLLPEYKAELAQAAGWQDISSDIQTAINNLEESEDWKKNVEKNISDIIEPTYTKQEALNAIEEVIDNTQDPVIIEDLEKVMKGLEDMNYHRDPQKIETRKERKARLEEAKRQEEERLARLKEELEVKKEEERARLAEEAARQAEEEAMKELAKNAALSKNIPANGEGIVEVPAEDEGITDVSKEDVEPVGELSSWNLTSALMEPDAEPGVLSAGNAKYKDGEQMTEGSLNVELKVKDNKNKTITFSLGKESLAIPVSSENYNFVHEGPKEGLTEETAKQNGISKDIPFRASSLEMVDGEWYFKGQFEGNNTSYLVKADSSFDLGKTLDAEITRRNQEYSSLENNTAENQIVETEDETTGYTAELEDEAKQDSSIEVQRGEAESLNAENEQMANTADNTSTTINGVAMHRYKTKSLVEEGSLQRQQGTEKNDKMNNYFSWMEAEGHHLQEVVDNELSDILKNKPDAIVHFVGINPSRNATNDNHVQTHLFLALDFDDSINPNITNIHNKDRGCVIESEGKKYLLIGVAGYGSNAGKQALYDRLWYTGKRENGEKSEGWIKKDRVSFFNKNPKERWFVHPALKTQVVPNSTTPGFLVKQLEGENTEGNTRRSIKDLIEDAKRNPQGIKFKDIIFGIQSYTGFSLSKDPKSKVPLIPRKSAENAGRVFALIPGGNNRLIPAYMFPLKYTEMRDGELKDEITRLLGDLSAGQYEVRLGALKKLLPILYLSKDGDNILLSKKADTVTLVNDSKGFRRVIDLMADNAREVLMQSLEAMNPRINLTMHILKDPKSFDKYNEAGAFMTDISQLATAGISYEVFGIDSDGNMIKTEYKPKASSGKGSTYKKEDTLLPYKGDIISYDKSADAFFINGRQVTDQKDIDNLKVNLRILEGGLIPEKTISQKEYYILNEANKEVIRRDVNSYEVEVLSEAEAEKFINKVKKEKEEEERKAAIVEAQKQTQKEIEEEGIRDIDFSKLTPVEDTDLSEEGIIDINPNNAVPAEDYGLSKEDIERANTPKENIIEQKETTPPSPVSGTKQGMSLSEIMDVNESVIDMLLEKFPDAESYEDLLRSKNIEVDNIDASPAGIKAWIETVKNCR